MTIILSSGVLYELIGPAAAKFALIRAGAMGKEPPHQHHHREKTSEDQTMTNV